MHAVWQIADRHADCYIGEDAQKLASLRAHAVAYDCNTHSPTPLAIAYILQQILGHIHLPRRPVRKTLTFICQQYRTVDDLGIYTI